MDPQEMGNSPKPRAEVVYKKKLPKSEQRKDCVAEQDRMKKELY